MVRSPVVAGQFYPGSPDELRSMLATLVDKNAVKEDVIGLLMPHAGYVYSGSVAGATISRAKLKDSFIIMGPNHTGLGRPCSIMTEGIWRTPLGEMQIDSELGKQLLVSSSYLEEDSAAHRGEHSIEVQLPFLQYFNPNVRFVPIVLSSASLTVYREIGREIAQVIKETNKEVIIIVSSDMSHYESQESVSHKDNQAIEAMLALDEDELFRRVRELDISMCGYAPAVSLVSAAKELGATKAELVKYQTSGDTSGDYRSVVGYAGIVIKSAEPSPLVRLARETVETYVKDGSYPQRPELTPEMKERAGVFVSIHKSHELRGCIGTFEPTTENVAEEIMANAVNSATRDPRFPPVSLDELKDLVYSVDVLSHPEPIEDRDQLDPVKYGVIVESGSRRGLLLPDLEGVDTAERQIDICRQKAGISHSEPVKLYRFQVKRYK